MRRKILVPLLNFDKQKPDLVEGRSNELDELKDIKDNMKIITESLMQITQQFKKIKSTEQFQDQNSIHGILSKQKEPFSERMQKRFQDVTFFIPELNKDESLREEVILTWLAQVCKTIFSVGFNMYLDGVLDINKVKAYCSENLLRNLLYFSQKNQLTQQELTMINEFLEKDLLPYYFQKYPQSEETQTSAKFSSDLIERNAMADNDYDLVYQSKVDFSFQESGNYNSQIMKFLNYIIGLPNKMIESAKGEEKGKTQKQMPLNEVFFAEMESIFRMVETENNTSNMLRYNPRKPTSFQWTMDQSSQKQRQEYQQKVKSYTSFQIGQKLSKNFAPFSDFEIQSGDLKLKNSQIMRILTKWCEQLEKCYDSNEIIKGQTLFRMQTGSKKYLSTRNMEQLAKFLQRQKVNLIEKMKEQIKKNNHKSQSQLMNEKVDKELLKLSKKDAIVGQFASFTFKNSASYLITYLNALIHGINLAAQQIKKQFQLENDEYIPQLITFKIGDLMRCKCSSKQKEIIALYREVERRHRQPNSNIKIIRVKNRLNQGNKDILMNLMYKDQIIVEMQLAIKSEKSKFIECSYNFCHYLYELQRAQFGPIMQMCNIWVNKDLKSKFYLEKMEKLNKRIKPQDLEQKKKFEEKIQNCCIKHQKAVLLPFRCSFCKCFYSSSKQVQNNIECQKCGAFTCQMCQLQISDYQSEKLFKKLDKKKIKQLENVEFITKIQGEGGAILNLKSKKRKLLYFINATHKNEFYLFQYNNKNKEVKLIEKFKSPILSRSFLKQNLVLTSPLIKKKISSEYQKAQQVISQYFVSNYLKAASQTEKSFVTIMNSDLKEETLQMQQIEDWPHVTSINLSENIGLNLKKVVQKFPNVEVAILNDIKINNFPDRLWKQLKIVSMFGCSLRNLDIFQDCDKIIDLCVSSNKISSLPNTSQNFQNLRNLQMSYGPLQNIPEQFCKLPKLEQLILEHNKLPSLPQSIEEMTSLRKLKLTSNQLVGLPESFGNLKKLEILQLGQNKISQLPDSFGKLIALRQLNLTDNWLTKLPQFFSQLSQLQNLQIGLNSLTEIPEWFGKLTELRILRSKTNKINKLPESFGNLRKLIQVNFENNHLESLPESFGNLSSLQKLFLSYNKSLSRLPQSFANLQNLEIFKMRSTKVALLPDNFGDLQSLKQVDFGYSLLQKLPSSFANLQSLTIIGLQNNNFTEIPKQICSLENLEVLKFYGNKISEVPHLLLEQQKLKELSFSILVNFNVSQNLFASSNSSIKIQFKYSQSFQEAAKKLVQLGKPREIQVIASVCK